MPENSSGTSSSKDLTRQIELDKKLVHSLNTKRIPSLKQLKYLSKILPPKHRRLLQGLILVIVISVVALGTTFYFKNFIPVPTAGGEYVEGLIGAPQFINPLLSQTNDVDSDISRLIFSGLLKYDSQLQLVPDLAESWRQSEDQKTYTFTIKDNLLWHDGEPLTADDVVFTLQSIKDPDFKSPLLISLRGVEITKIDSRTVNFILPNPYPSFLEILTVGILPEHIWGEIPPINANLTEFNVKPVGSGAWKFKSLIKDRLGNIKSYTIEPFEKYYGAKPYLEKITFKFYPDFETAVAAVKNNSVEGISFLPKDLKHELEGRKAFNFHSFYLPQYTAVFFNQKQNEALKDKNVRHALALAIDKSKILGEALQLEGEIIDGPILPTGVTIDEDKKTNFDPNSANELLDESGWKKITPEEYQNLLKEQAEQVAAETAKTATAESTEDEAPNNVATTTEITAPPTEEAPFESEQAFYRKKSSTILEIALSTVNQPENVKAAELIKQAWQNIGVKVSLQIIEGSRISRELIKPRNYQVLLFGIIVGSNPDPFPFWHSSQVQDPGLNLALFANREVDSLLEKARTDSNPETQQASYQRFQDILLSEIPAIFLHNPTYTYVVDKKIKGSNIDRIIVPSDRFNDIQDWYIKTKRRYQGAFH